MERIAEAPESKKAKTQIDLCACVEWRARLLRDEDQIAANNQVVNSTIVKLIDIACRQVTEHECKTLGFQIFRHGKKISAAPQTSRANDKVVIISDVLAQQRVDSIQIRDVPLDDAPEEA